MPDPLDARGPIAVFDSIHAVLAAERAFLARALACDILPAPRELSSDCGMVLLLRKDDLEAARIVLAGPPLREHVRGVYVRGPGGYTEITDSQTEPADGGAP